MKRLLYFITLASCMLFYNCSDAVVGDGSEDTVIPGGKLDSLEDLYGEVKSVEFGDENVSITFASGKTFNFAYPDAIIPYIGKNGNWWINGTDTGCTSTGKDGADGEDGKDGADGENGEDGKDGVDGENGQNGVDGEDGKDGADGQNGADGQDGEDGKDGQDGADGADGVGIASVKYDNGKLTITLTDGTSSSFVLGTSDSGSLVGTVDCLNDTTPMLISAVVCGDTELMNFKYDNQNRIVGAAYNTTEFNQPVPFVTMKREYKSDYQYTTTLSTVATYDGQTEAVYDDECDFYDRLDISQLCKVYTTSELINLLSPDGIKYQVYNTDGSTSYIDSKIGEQIDFISEEDKSIIDCNFANMFNERFYNYDSKPIYTIDDKNITLYYIMSAESCGIYDEWDPIERKYCVYSETYPRNINFERVSEDVINLENGDYDDDPDYKEYLNERYPAYYNVVECNDETYIRRLPVNSQYEVYTVGCMFKGGSIQCYDGDEAHIQSEFGENYESIVHGIYAPNLYREYIESLTKVNKVDKNTSLAEFVGNGDGYKEYTVSKSYGNSNGKYFYDGVVDNSYKYIRSNSEVNYRVYEKGAMIDSASIYLTENEEGQLVGTAGTEDEPETEDKIIFTMDGDYIKKVRLEYMDYRYEEYYDENLDYDGDGIPDGGYVYEEYEELVSQDIMLFTYNSDMRLEDITLYDEDKKAYENLFNIVYDDNDNPVQIQVNGAEIQAIGDDAIDEVMEIIGVASKHTTLDIESGEVTETYVYNTTSPTEVVNITYNYDYKNFFGNSLNALNIMPFGIELSNAVEEIHWAGHSSYLFSEYSNFNTAGYPTTAKLSASINPAELEGYGAPTISGVSAAVSFEYINKK